VLGAILIRFSDMVLPPGIGNSSTAGRRSWTRGTVPPGEPECRERKDSAIGARSKGPDHRRSAARAMQVWIQLANLKRISKLHKDPDGWTEDADQNGRTGPSLWRRYAGSSPAHGSRGSHRTFQQGLGLTKSKRSTPILHLNQKGFQPVLPPGAIASDSAGNLGIGVSWPFLRQRTGICFPVGIPARRKCAGPTAGSTFPHEPRSSRDQRPRSL